MLGNKNRIPLICPPNDSEILAKMMLIESIKRIEKPVIVPIIMKEPEDIGTIGTIGAGKLNTSFALAALALTQISSANKSNHTTIIDDRVYSERDGNLMRIHSTEYFGNTAIDSQLYLNDTDYMSPKMSLQKKDRKHNNRKTNKRKKAKNGR